MTVYDLFAVFVVASGADIVLTYLIIANGGRELNPLLGHLMHKIGVLPTLFASKAIAIVIAAIVGSQSPQWLAFLVLLMLAVVAWNGRVYFGIKDAGRNG